jgi:hypothetical protein
MRTAQWSLHRVATGKYHVRLTPIGDKPKSGQVIPGMILGGNGKWVVQVGGNQWPETFKTRNEAAELMVCRHIGIAD